MPAGNPQRYLLGVEYCGARFSGFQKQTPGTLHDGKPAPEIRTVQETLERALTAFAGHDVQVMASSRTDSGVHATENVCGCDITRLPRNKRKGAPNAEPDTAAAGAADSQHAPPTPAHPPYAGVNVRDAVNHFLRRNGDEDLRVTACVAAHSDWHPRFSATGRVYRYIVCEGAAGGTSVFQRGTCWSLGSRTIPAPLDVAAMRAAASNFIGEHDFTSFRALGCQAKSPVRTITRCTVDTFGADGAGGPFSAHPYLLPRSTALLEAAADERALASTANGDAPDERAAKIPRSATGSESQGEPCSGVPGSRFIVVTVASPGFLYHQVRLMVGALVLVGMGKAPPSHIRALLGAPTPPGDQHPNLMAAMAPPEGLFLCSVSYDASGVFDGTPRPSR